jgi:hypothetical protein
MQTNDYIDIKKHFLCVSSIQLKGLFCGTDFKMTLLDGQRGIIYKKHFHDLIECQVLKIMCL